MRHTAALVFWPCESRVRVLVHDTGVVLELEKMLVDANKYISIYIYILEHV